MILFRVSWNNLCTSSRVEFLLFNMESILCWFTIIFLKLIKIVNFRKKCIKVSMSQKDQMKRSQTMLPSLEQNSMPYPLHAQRIIWWSRYSKELHRLGALSRNRSCHEGLALWSENLHRSSWDWIGFPIIWNRSVCTVTFQESEDW